MYDNTEEIVKMLVRFYNLQAGTGFYSNAEQTKNAVLSAVERCNNDLALVKENIKTFVKETPEIITKDKSGFIDCFESMKGKDTTPVTAPEAPTANSIAGSLGILEHALMVAIREQSIPVIEEDLRKQCTQLLQDFIKKEYGTIERKVVTVVDGERKELPAGTFLHDKFDDVLKFVSKNKPVFLTGPAGSGKNHLCKQVADALGLKFYFTNAVTQEYKLTGFTDANGNYQPTQFYEAFKNGGLFMLDEMDASIPDVLVILNAAIANRYFDFPAPIGYVEAHPDFRVIAAGNTTGHGADYEYVGRNQLDGASLDRFSVIPIDYSTEIENGIAGDIELADFCREFRKASQKVGVQVIVSYRAIGTLAEMIPLLSLEDALRYCLVKGLEKDDINVICNELKDSKYKTALKKLMA